MNKNPAPAPQKTPKPLEMVTARSRRVACDGPEFGKHPRIYLTIGPENQVFCPYCSRNFVLAKDLQNSSSSH